jgi:hypothetical protein
LLGPVDLRIGKLCDKYGLIYTRYVDDITISAQFDLERSGFPSIIRRILDVSGFEVNESKCHFAQKAGAVITGLQVSRGHPDVPVDYLERVVAQIHDADRLGRGEPFIGPYYSQSQIWGRVRFVCWANPRRRKTLMPLLKNVDWAAHRQAALDRGLVAATKRVIPTKQLFSGLNGGPE